METTQRDSKSPAEYIIEKNDRGGDNPYSPKCWNPAGCGPRCQLVIWGLDSFFSPKTQPAYTCFVTRKKKDKTSSSLKKKNSALANLCNQEVTFTSCRNIKLLYEWPLWSLLRSGSIDSFCCWGWQQVHDWERPLGCKRKGRAERRNTEQNWSEGKQVSGSQLTESSTRPSGTNPVTRQHRGAIQPLP